MQLDMCIYTHVLHNIEMLVGWTIKNKKKIWAEWMPGAKEIFPHTILGTRAIGSPALA